MLFQFASVLLVASIQLVAAADPPEFAPPHLLAAGGDPETTLQPYVGNPVKADDAVDDTKVIRGLLITRQSCSNGYGLCNDGGCCPVGGQCCGGRKCCGSGKWCYSTGCCNRNENGCDGVSCCPSGTNCCKGGGCCQPGFYCTVVNGKKGCCRDGKICTSGGGGGNSECENTGYVRCAGEDFCCPAGYTCYRDSANAAKCRRYTDSTYTITRSSPYPTPTSSPSPRTTSTPDSDNSNDDIGDGLPDDSGTGGSDGLGLNSTSSSSRSSSRSTPSPTPTELSSSNINGVADWRGSLAFFGIAPFFAWIVYLL